jgi:hypothetical protein
MKNRLIFILSIIFITQSCTHNNSNLKNRIPAAKDESCAELVLSFYKKQNIETIQSRIEATRSDPHKFYRSFPPVYFNYLNDLDLEADLGPIVKLKGVIGGDVHVENFGVRPFKGERRLLINDFDDLSEGPIVYDILRLLTSIRLTGYKTDKKFVKDFIQRYQEGLQTKKENFSDTTKKFFKEAKKSNRVDKKKISLSDKKFLMRREPSFNTTDEEISAWTKLMENEGKVLDSYKYIKESGGSGGLDRYELLVENLKGEIFWLEAKEWEAPGINAGIGTEAPSFARRLSHVQRYDQPEFVSLTKSYQGKVFFIREVNDSHISVSISGLSNKELTDLFMDEAYALGDFHKTHGIPSNYESELEKIKANTFLELVKKIHSEFKDLAKKK